MPDWFYRTVSRPALFLLPAENSRSLALGLMGRLAALPCGVGGRIIDFLGHMRPDARLARSAFGLEFPSPVGLGLRLDPAGCAARAWTRFGFGFIEVGPVTLEAAAPATRMERRPGQEALWLPDPGECFDAKTIHARLGDRVADQLPFIVRLKPGTGSSPDQAAGELAALVDQLRDKARLFSIDALRRSDWSASDWRVFGEELRRRVPRDGPKFLLVMPADASRVSIKAALDGAGQLSFAGILLDGGIVSEKGCLSGAPARQPALDCLRWLRQEARVDIPIIASGGIHQPADARDFLDAGASFIQIDTGLIYSGPGLCKRINEALLWQSVQRSPAAASAAPLRPAECSWFWTTLLGVAMLLGSVLALIIAVHPVVLPYDEAFCGWTRAQMRAFNPRLLHFLSHDRVTLAGTMVSIGVLYLSLSWNGVRRGLHWARMAVLVSAGTGFFSFFLFLGFGYFDPFHGFVTAVLFQLFAMGVHAKELPRLRIDPPDWIETRAWRSGQWGQLLLVIHSVGLLGAGVIIASVGVRDVLVAEDLGYLQTNLDSLRLANSRLVPLVAHDRATLGGMLAAAGLVYLLASLWGLRRGTAWLWHTFLWSGLAAYAAAIGVHYAVGYIDLRHLLPAFAGLGLLLGGLACSFAWCHQRETTIRT